MSFVQHVVAAGLCFAWCSPCLAGGDRLEERAQIACAKKGMSETHSMIAEKTHSALESELGKMQSRVKEILAYLDYPVDLEREHQIAEARKWHQQEITIYRQMLSAGKLNSPESEVQQTRIIEARDRLQKVERGPAAAELIQEKKTLAQRELVDLAEKSGRYLELREKVRYCWERAKGFPGQAFSPDVDTDATLVLPTMSGVRGGR